MAQQRVVLVTGGARGVGRGIAEAFLAAGDRVVVCARNAPEALPVHDDSRAEFIAADVRKSESVAAMMEEIGTRFGRLDVLVNNAGGSPFAEAAEASPRFHRAIVELNLLAPLELAQHANRLMQAQDGGGAIVFVGSISAVRPSPGTAAYGAAKAGIVSLTQSLAVEWGPRVRVVCVSPGLVETEQSHLHYGDAEGIRRVADTIPLRRLAQPREIGDACVWMSGPGAGYVSGSNMVIHGGGERPSFLAEANVNRE
ncbi:SDR family oxidoreductase [Algiphilus sp.]|uniref:SDR family oxidoreductase n=1 Tax=Algiphilus sp. TaxID=1872431 RepID=UPI0025B932C5|nr:SDR family oxidoreductase [Algiphilus sp.]MCK5769652.1 SDR family oxidoreductase [Algiphilus sp.]